MDLLLKALPIFLTTLIVRSLFPTLLKYLYKTFPAKKRVKPKIPSFPSKVKPSHLDLVLFATIIFLIISGLIFAVIATIYIKQWFLDFVFDSPDNLFVVPYGFGPMAGLLFGLILGSGATDLVTSIVIKIISAVSGKTTKQLTPWLYSQSEDGLGLDGNKLKVMLYGKIGGALLIITIIGCLGGYTRFTRNGLIHSDWPGLTQRTYGYQQITDIWHIRQFKNRMTGKIEDTGNYYIVVFEDGWTWKTTNLIPEMWQKSYTSTGEAIDRDFIAKFLAIKANLNLKSGIKNVDVQ